LPAKLILVAQVAGAFGVRGEVRLTAFTEDPLAMLDYGVLLNAAGAPVLTMKTGRAVKGAVIGEADEIATREQAEAMRGLKLYIDRSALPPAEDEDEFYLVDLIGLEVVSPAGEPLGRVKFVANFGAGDLLEIAPATPGEASWYAPFTKAVVPGIDLAAGRIVVDRPPETEATPEPYPNKNKAEP
jgi:16S rRNA processing protein RimM